MAGIRFAIRTVGFVFTVATAICPGGSAAAEFKAEAVALPFPPDAREVEFVGWTGGISYTSHSPLKSLGAFYLKEMADRGWEHDESAAEIEEDSITLTFKHGEASVELELDRRSKEVRVEMDCEGLEFTGTDDPSKLVAAGIPMPRATVFLQKEFSLSDVAKEVDYDADGCTLKSSMKLAEAFDHFAKLAKGKGFRQSRKPIISDKRRYTEFKKGSAELSVNVFTHAVGSRIVLTYEDQRKETPVPPLPAVASLTLDKSGGGDRSAADEPATAPAAKTPIDVTGNQGSATVDYGGKKYAFAHVACYRGKEPDSDPTLLFSAKPIPLNKIQARVATEDDFSFSELYDLDFPDHLVLRLGDSPTFSLSIPGVGIGRGVEKSVNEMKIEAGRVRGTFKMLPEEILSRQVSFTATMDAAIITPTTRIAGPGDPVERSDAPTVSDLPMPRGAEDVQRKGSKFRKTYIAVVAMSAADVASFYRKELVQEGWKRVDAGGADGAMQFKNETAELSVALKQQGAETAIEIVRRDAAAAKREGVLPEPGMGRLVLANAGRVGVTFTIGQKDYRLAAGRGAKDFKRALNYSVKPGAYSVVVKIPGQRQQTERLEITEGTTWAIIALPTGGHLPTQLY